MSKTWTTGEFGPAHFAPKPPVERTADFRDVKEKAEWTLPSQKVD